MLFFKKDFEENILQLLEYLASEKYSHGEYESFFVHDPKRRHIHKAQVADRVIHHAIHRILEPIFDKTFIFDSYSSRKNKGTHKAMARLNDFAWKLSENNTKTVWILKCDIRKFFDSVDQEILFNILGRKITDERTLRLLGKIISSYNPETKRGIPLGNLTSQLFSNIYLNLLDQFVKRDLRVKHYIRYADDFVFLSRDKKQLEEIIPIIRKFLKETLALEMHEDKLSLSKFHKGLDYLGFVHFPHFSVVRTKTKRRMFKKLNRKFKDLKSEKISSESFNQTKQSYLGILSHSQNKGLIKIIKNKFPS